MRTQYYIWVTTRHSSSQQGTQQENSATKQVITRRSSCNSCPWQSEWGFTFEFVDKVLLWTTLHG